MLRAGSVSKLKAQLRQTKRLLARVRCTSRESLSMLSDSMYWRQDDLNPDVRVTSERRLVVLEEELAKAEQSNKEKKMVQRYRGVKFFGALASLSRGGARARLTRLFEPRRTPETPSQDQAGEEAARCSSRRPRRREDATRSAYRPLLRPRALSFTPASYTPWLTPSRSATRKPRNTSPSFPTAPSSPTSLPSPPTRLPPSKNAKLCDSRSGDK